MADGAFALNNESLVTRLQTCSDLPSPPSVAERIIQLGQDPAARLDEVVSVIKTDPALTAKLLRMANSPLYARQRRIDNLRQALLLFGLNGTLTLALSFSMVSALRVGAGRSLDYNLYWRRSIGVAAAAQSLGSQLQLGSREELFLAGLLQDMGMLALDKSMPDLYGCIRAEQSQHTCLIDYERRQLDTDHAAVGAWLLRSWNLSEGVCYAAAASHARSESRVPEVHRGLADCVNLGAAVADVWLRDDSEQAVEEAAERAERLMGIDRQALEGLMDSVRDTLADTSTLFNVDLGDAEHMDRILSQAKEVLLMRNLVAIQEAQVLRQQTETLSSRTRILEEEVNRDALTGIFSRKYLDQVLSEEFEAARQHSWPLAIAFVDLDHFKTVNDRYGHQNGDVVLRDIAQMLQDLCRDTDTVGRYGGEEFVVVLPGTELTGARIVCDRILETGRGMQHCLSKGESVRVTASIGLAVHGEAATFADLDALIRAADLALYDAKTQGRDRLVVYEPRPA